MNDKSFYTIDTNVVTDCCDSLRANHEVAVGIDTPGGREVVRGRVNRIRRIADDRFEIWVTQPPQHEIISDGRVVWVNAANGCCLARFSKNGIDVHHDLKGQETGIQCLDCAPGPTDLAAWRQFQLSVLRYHGIDVDDSYKPKFLDQS